MKTRLEQLLPRANSLPTTRKDNRDVDQFIAFHTVGLFASKVSGAIARADRDHSIQRYKQRDLQAWIDNNINVTTEIKTRGFGY